MPDFLGQLHKATLNYAAAKKHNETRIVSSVEIVVVCSRMFDWIDFFT